jgi:FixJ family two-component response regulator
VASEIPVILITALGGPLDRVKGGIEGAVRFLTKPMDLDDLRAAVTHALEGPERAQRLKAQHEALEMLARIERNGAPMLPDTAPRPRLSGLERGPGPPRTQPPPPRIADERLASLTDKQRALLEAVASASTIIEAAARLEMSRSNVYASLRRISRKLGTQSVRDLLDTLRRGDIFH